MSIITAAPHADTLILNDKNPALFMPSQKPNPGQPTPPCILSVPGASNLDLRPFNVTASGSIEPQFAGNITLTLYGLTLGYAPDTDMTDPANWVALSSSPVEPVERDVETQWMIQGVNLMFSTGSGKMQGSFLSNVADNPQASTNLTNKLFGILASFNPAILFAVGATFTGSGGSAPYANLQLYQFAMTD
jgi:hypothetical protein